LQANRSVPARGRADRRRPLDMRRRCGRARRFCPRGLRRAIVGLRPLPWTSSITSWAFLAVSIATSSVTRFALPRGGAPGGCPCVRYSNIQTSRPPEWSGSRGPRGSSRNVSQLLRTPHRRAGAMQINGRPCVRSARSHHSANSGGYRASVGGRTSCIFRSALNRFDLRILSGQWTQRHRASDSGRARVISSPWGSAGVVRA